jgi:adenylate cyclase
MVDVMLEIERKFLVQDHTSWRADVTRSTPIKQGYMSTQPTVRVRQFGHTAYLTIKGPTQGITRAEFEYEIPLNEALIMLDTLCLPGRIIKTRHEVVHAGKLWVVDVFEAENQGLVLAEIELETQGEEFERPPWLGKEVSDDPRYFNSALAREPISTWR